MKKILFLITVFTGSFTSYSQVGIATITPAATLDVVGKSTTTTVPDGIIAPRLTGDQLKAKDAVYLAAQTGALVYVTAAASPTTAKTINVTSEGYYYLDGTPVWQKLITPAAAGISIIVGNVLGTTTVAIAAGATADIPGATFTINPTANVRFYINISALGVPTTASAPAQGTINLVQNGTIIASQYYSGQDAPSGLVRLGNFSTITRVVDLTPSTYTFKLSAKSWVNSTTFNIDPVAGGYGGAITGDANAMKASISYQVFTR
jgi:hypothetical protein